MIQGIYCIRILCIIVGFSIGPFEWYQFETLPLFFIQLISAYEGIGCVSAYITYFMILIFVIFCCTDSSVMSQYMFSIWL